MMYAGDVCVVGGGIVGLAIARELARRFPKTSIALVEKESRCGLHASGRNSGVLHAGFYYSKDSMKAKLTRQGNLEMTEFISRHGIALNRCGKLVVAQNEQQRQVFDTLLERAHKNQVPLERISEKEAKEIEPKVLTYKEALWSPSTSSADPRQVAECMTREVTQLGVKVFNDCTLLGCSRIGNRGWLLKTEKGTFEAGVHVFNAAGLYADRVARMFGYGNSYAVTLTLIGLLMSSDSSI
jgi:L-2-hydroxyglutarate oxidase LhgO